MDIIRSINSIRNVPHSELNLLVKNVAVILCSSRSGSSLLKSVLELHPDIASLDGEIEPYLALTRNGFGYGSGSDAIKEIRNTQYLIDNILDGLSIFSKKEPDPDWTVERWLKRLVLQFPAKFAQEQHSKKLLDDLNAISRRNGNSVSKDVRLTKNSIFDIFADEPWRIGYYDGFSCKKNGKWFDEYLKIEEPPFVLPRINRESLGINNVANKLLLFKTPADAYRIGMYEDIFPNADIKYIHLTRGYAQSVNGLMDGWLSPVGFFSHNLQELGFVLNIDGYSNKFPFGKSWWKFDLPPNWQIFLTSKLEDVCLNQWISAHESILSSSVDKLRVSFEDFLTEPSVVLDRISKYLNINKTSIPQHFPVLMATEDPKLQRWRKREDLLLTLGCRKEVAAMMNSLGYEMNPETWL